MNRVRLLVTTGAALIALVIGLTLHQWQETMDLDEPAPVSGPELVMEGVRAHGFSETGEPDYWMQALAINRHQGTPARTLVAMPRLEVRQDTARWTFEALRGRIRGENEEIVFDGEVQARRISDPPVEVRTEHMIYVPDSGAVTAPGPVRIEHEGGHTRAGALRASVPSGRLELIEGVESRYVPAS